MGKWLKVLEPDEKKVGLKFLIWTYKIRMRKALGGFEPKINQVRMSKIQYDLDTPLRPTTLRK